MRLQKLPCGMNENVQKQPWKDCRASAWFALALAVSQVLHRWVDGWLSIIRPASSPAVLQGDRVLFPQVGLGRHRIWRLRRRRRPSRQTHRASQHTDPSSLGTIRQTLTYREIETNPRRHGDKAHDFRGP